MIGMRQNIYALWPLTWILLTAWLCLAVRPEMDVAAAGANQYVLAIIPVHWQGSRQEFEYAATQQASFFVESSNLGAFVDIQVIMFADNFRGASLSDHTLVYEMHKYALEREPADRYIGLTDGDLAPFGEKSVAGWTFGPGAPATIAEAGYLTVTAHELGHTFELCDEYLFSEWKRQDDRWNCPNPYPPSCSREHYRLCDGLPRSDGRRSIMGPAGSDSNYAFNEPSYSHLQEVFSDMFGHFDDKPADTPEPPTPAPPAPERQVRVALSEPDLLIVEPDGNIRRLAPGPVYHMAWSPDGREVAFAAAYEGNLDIYHIPAAGGEPQAILSWPSRELHPEWTADGRHMIFVSDKDGFFQLYAVSLDDGTVRELDGFPQPASWPDLSHDGRQIAFAAAPDGDWAIYTASLDEEGALVGGRPHRLSPPETQVFAPAWHPDGHILAWSQQDAVGEFLHIMDMELGTSASFTGDTAGWAPVWYSRSIILLQTVRDDHFHVHGVAARSGTPVALPAIFSRAGWPTIFQIEEGP